MKKQPLKEMLKKIGGGHLLNEARKYKLGDMWRKDFDYEGIIYKRLPADNMILNRRCGRQLGILLEDGTIEFFGEEEKAVHIKNKE